MNDWMDGWIGAHLLINFACSCQKHNTNHTKTRSHDLTYKGKPYLQFQTNTDKR